MIRSVLAAVALALSLTSVAHADGLAEELKARRERLMTALGTDTIAIFWSAPERPYSRDVEYEYRQDSDLLYLTGVTQPETILVLMPGNRTRRELLFILPPDAKREHWTGHRLTSAEATALTGVAHVYTVPQFVSFLEMTLNEQPFGMKNRSTDPTDPEYATFFGALRSGQAKIALRLPPTPGLDAPLGPEREFAQKARDRLLTVTFVDTAPLLANLRQVKTPYEQQVLARSVEISSEAHIAGMRTARPGRYEYEVEAAIEQVYLSNGAMSPGYPSIVGSGPNATTLHYNASSRRMEDGDLLLVDAAANYQGLTGDITRTYPVNGRFTPQQQEIYQIVLAAQEAGMKAAKAGNHTTDIEKAAADVIRQGLLKLGLITDASGDQFRTWYTHGICHFIGMDVHDVGDYARPLEPGMAFTIEPGLYIRPAALESLEDTQENRGFREKVAPVAERYKDIGVRIEDSFLLTDTGPTMLSAKVPRTIEDIERLLASRSEQTGTGRD
jgi:Xaa-Pro aminopeptidase